MLSLGTLQKARLRAKTQKIQNFTGSFSAASLVLQVLQRTHTRLFEDVHSHFQISDHRRAVGIDSSLANAEKQPASAA